MTRASVRITDGNVPVLVAVKDPTGIIERYEWRTVAGATAEFRSVELKNGESLSFTGDFVLSDKPDGRQS